MERRNIKKTTSSLTFWRAPSAANVARAAAAVAVVVIWFVNLLRGGSEKFDVEDVVDGGVDGDCMSADIERRVNGVL